MRRVSSRWRTPLGQFVSDFGVQRLTRELASAGVPVTQKAVYHWLAGSHAPRPTHAAAIARVSAGRVSVEDVYRHRDVVVRSSAG